MTTREIADFNEVSTRTVRRWVDKLSGEAGQNAISQEKIKLLEAGEAGRPVDWSENEVYAIMTAGGRGAVAKWMRDAKVNNSSKVFVEGPQNTEVAHLGAMVANLVVIMNESMKMMVTQQNQIATILANNHYPAERKTLPAPTLDPRAHIIKLANEYVSKTGIEHRDAYTMLYREFGYRTHCNAILSAKNRGMKIIDYIDSEGQIETLEAIALEAFAS